MNLLYSASLLPPHAYELVASRGIPALGITIAFALVAFGLRAVTPSGAVAGIVCTFLICLSAGPAGFFCVLVVFALTVLTTRFGLRRKLLDGTAEPHEGRRAAQIFANLGAATVVAVPVMFHRSVAPVLLSAMIASLAEAAADTVSSEIGQSTGRSAYLITTMRRVPIGTNGAVTVAGSVAGIVAAGIVCWAAVRLEVIAASWWIPSLLAGLAGWVVDSILGATIERPGRLGNNAVNFLSTTVAAALLLVYGIFLLV